mmetsp:Transcript_69202/g.214800  ORF Transcript_69202/g.214800 Transcript_69202/m.214800 type:complete len:418 (-) Transcript_69202:507-1760(-)
MVPIGRQRVEVGGHEAHLQALRQALRLLQDPRTLLSGRALEGQAHGGLGAEAEGLGGDVDAAPQAAARLLPALHPAHDDVPVLVHDLVVHRRRPRRERGDGHELRDGLLEQRELAGPVGVVLLLVHLVLLAIARLLLKVVGVLEDLLAALPDDREHALQGRQRDHGDVGAQDHAEGDHDEDDEADHADVHGRLHAAGRGHVVEDLDVRLVDLEDRGPARGRGEVRGHVQLAAALQALEAVPDVAALADLERPVGAPAVEAREAPELPRHPAPGELDRLRLSHARGALQGAVVVVDVGHQHLRPGDHGLVHLRVLEHLEGGQDHRDADDEEGHAHGEHVRELVRDDLGHLHAVLRVFLGAQEAQDLHDPAEAAGPGAQPGGARGAHDDEGVVALCLLGVPLWQRGVRAQREGVVETHG